MTSTQLAAIKLALKAVEGAMKLFPPTPQGEDMLKQAKDLVRHHESLVK